MATRLAAGATFAGLLCLALSAPPGTARGQDFPFTLDARAVPLADGLAPGARLGRVRFLGMLELPTLQLEHTRLSQLSGLAWDDDDQILYAISDKGWLFHLRPLLRGDLLHGVQLLAAVPLREPETKAPLKRQRADSEGLDIVNGRNGRRGDAELLVSFERQPRVVRYRPDGSTVREHPPPAALRDARAYRDRNKQLEAICVDERLGILVAPEVPRKDDRADALRISSFRGDAWRYPLAAGHRITALECLGNGEVLVMETDYGRLLAHSALALRRARLPAGPGTDSAAQVETLMELDTGRGYALDNFEGLARHRGMRFFLVSDNNDLFFQRMLLLYLELLPPES